MPVTILKNEVCSHSCHATFTYSSPSVINTFRLQLFSVTSLEKHPVADCHNTLELAHTHLLKYDFFFLCLECDVIQKHFSASVTLGAPRNYLPTVNFCPSLHSKLRNFLYSLVLPRIKCGLFYRDYIVLQTLHKLHTHLHRK